MKKLLFSLAAAATCGVAAAAPATATFDGATFDPAKPDDGGEVTNENRIYWEINTNSVPELVAAGEGGAALGYLQINTGNTPLWRTFSGVSNPTDATDADLDAAAVTNGVVVSSDVKLTACTEWPTLTDFANEKLALFLYAPEDEAAAAAHPGGLYAVGGAMVDNVLTAKAYKLDIAPASVTNDQGWATIAIKSYDNIISEGDGVAAFVIAVNGNIVAVDTEDTDYTGFSSKPLFNAAATRLGNKQLIPAAIAGATFQGLGFQGEGGIDDVKLAATDFAVDAVTMTATITGATVTWTSEGTSLDGTTLTFVPDSAVTFEVAKNAGLDILTVTYNGSPLTAENGVYTITNPAANATLDVTAVAAKFAVEGVGSYATFNEALNAAIAAGKAVKLASNVDLGNTVLTFAGDAESNPRDITLDLAGKTLTGAGNSGENALAVIMVAGDNLTITDTVGGGKVTAGIGCYAIHNASGSLTIEAGEYNGQILTSGQFAEGLAYINGGTFSDITGLAVVEGGNVTLKSGMEWSDLTEGYYTLVKAGGEPEPEVPTVDEEVGEVVVADGNATVTVTNASESVTVTVPTNFTGTVSAVVPPAVSSIAGVSAAANVTVEAEGVNITGAFTITYDSTTKTATIALDEAGKVTIEGEEIPVKPVLADDDAEGVAVAPFEVSAEGDAAANVAAIPGLTYELVTTDDLDSNEFGPIVGDDEVVLGAKKKATGKRVKLEDKRSNKGAKGFYKVKVSK